VSFRWRLVDLVPVKNQAIYGGFGLQAAGLDDRVDRVEDGEVYAASAYRVVRRQSAHSRSALVPHKTGGPSGHPWAGRSGRVQFSIKGYSAERATLNGRV
jgi:hypothetical protein